MLKLDGEVSVVEQFTTLLDELKEKYLAAELAWLWLYHLPDAVPFEVKASLSMDCIGRRWAFEDHSPLTLVELFLTFQPPGQMPQNSSRMNLSI